MTYIKTLKLILFNVLFYEHFFFINIFFNCNFKQHWYIDFKFYTFYIYILHFLFN